MPIYKFSDITLVCLKGVAYRNVKAFGLRNIAANLEKLLSAILLTDAN